MKTGLGELYKIQIHTTFMLRYLKRKRTITLTSSNSNCKKPNRQDLQYTHIYMNTDVPTRMHAH